MIDYTYIYDTKQTTNALDEKIFWKTLKISKIDITNYDYSQVVDKFCSHTNNNYFVNKLKFYLSDAKKFKKVKYLAKNGKINGIIFETLNKGKSFYYSIIKKLIEY